MKHFNYSKTEFSKVVDFLATNNKYFLGEHAVIAKALQESIDLVVSDSSEWISTMGFTLLKKLEGKEDGDEFWWIDILVTLAVSIDLGEDDDVLVLVDEESIPSTLKSLNQNNEVLDLANNNIDSDKLN